MFNSLVYYMLSKGEAANVNSVIEKLKTIEDYEEDVMNAAQQLKQQGRQEGRYEIAKNLLAEGWSLDLVKKVTQLPDLDLSELEKA